MARGLGTLPVISEPRCNICQSPNRKQVDKLLAAGYSGHSIAEELIALDPNFKDKRIETVRKNVFRHSKAHVNVKERSIRATIEKRALEAGVLIDEVEGQLGTSRSLLDLVIAKGHEQLVDPDYRVRMADVIEATKMLEDTQRQEYLAKVEVMQRQVWAISEALKITMRDSEQLNKVVELANRLFENPEVLDTPEFHQLKELTT